MKLGGAFSERALKGQLVQLKMVLEFLVWLNFMTKYIVHHIEIQSAIRFE